MGDDRILLTLKTAWADGTRHLIFAPMALLEKLAALTPRRRGAYCKLDFDTVILGHGPVTTRADLIKFKGDFERMRNRVSDLLRQNRGKDEVSSALVNEYGWPAGGLAIAQVDRLIAELRR